MNLLRLAPLVALSFLLAAPVRAENWPAWRGPTGDGVCTETALPKRWSATENVRWKVALPERGNSTPIVWDDRIFLTQAVGDRRTLMCLARPDGKLLWQEGPTWTEKETTHGTNPYCSSSPVTDGERVVAWFGSAGIWCWDLAGKEQWHVDLGKQEHIWGNASSPIFAGDLCILNFGPGERSFLVALNKKTGQEVWRTPVPAPEILEGSGANQKWGGSWSTPILWKTGDRTEMVVGLPGAVRGFDPASGKELWHCNGLNPLVYANPLIADGIIAGMGGYNGYAIGFKPDGEGDLTTTYRLWQEKKNNQRIGSGVAKDGYIYMVNEPGVVQCIEAKTGQIVWAERPKVPSTRASTWSSLVLAGDQLYMVTQASDTVVLRAAPKFEQLAVYSLDDGLTNSSLAISNGDVFLRTHRSLWCLSEKR